ncbi:hypothetical protein COR50_01560 [Chitinophaga caeni]|uniref:Uncharacterized protein n=1 Tax=Chitinophaga caeni TaxID=2029983 RepID=A0A291QPZ1_9BACT|nr:hypothetical protein COR50_01560 [Chitinophaga caeni]
MHFYFLLGQGYKRRMIYSAPPRKPWNFAPLIGKQNSSTKARSSDQIGGRDDQFVPFSGTFLGKRKSTRNEPVDIESNF